MARAQTEYNLNNIIIDQGVEKPVSRGGRVDKWYYVFSKMNIGDSFALPYETDEEASKVRNAIHVAYRSYVRKHEKSFKGGIRTLFIKKEIRFWRDA